MFHCENFNQYYVTFDIQYSNFEDLRKKIDNFDELVDIKNRNLIKNDNTPNRLQYKIFPTSA